MTRYLFSSNKCSHYVKLWCIINRVSAEGSSLAKFEARVFGTPEDHGFSVPDARSRYWRVERHCNVGHIARRKERIQTNQQRTDHTRGKPPYSSKRYAMRTKKTSQTRQYIAHCTARYLASARDMLCSRHCHIHSR